MFYCFDKTVKEVRELSASPTRPSAAYLTVDELEKIAPIFAFSPQTVRECRMEPRYFRSSIEVYDDYSFGTVKRTGGGPEGTDCIGFFVRKNLFLLVDIRDSDGSTRACFDRALTRFPASAVTAERLVFAFLDALIEGDAKHLEDREFALSRLEEGVLFEGAEQDFTRTLLHHKQSLLLLHNYYQQLIDVGEALGENENGVLGDGELRYLGLFTARAERLLRNVETLREQLSQLREAYQSTLELGLNRTMKAFTALNAVFLPLSLIAGWYGMNFDMPEFAWRHGYLFAAGLSVFVVSLCVYIFKKHRWL